MSFTQVMDYVTRGFEAAGVIVLIIGFLSGVARALHAYFTGHAEASYGVMRRYFGRSILLGLEILVAADLIRTVAVDPTWQNVAVLGLIVLIRTFLSFSLEVEMDGVWPWRRWQLGPQEAGGGRARVRRLKQHRGSLTDHAGAPGARWGHTGRMTRVLIVVANREQFPEPAFPCGALYVAGAVEAAGGRARVFDAGLHRRPLTALRAELREWRPDAVGLSLRNADNAAWPCTNSYTAWYAEIAAAAREAAPQARLVLGGPAFSIFPREMRRAVLVRDGVVADGEVAMRLLVDGCLPEGIVERPLDGPGERPPARGLRLRLPRRRALSHRRRPERARLPARLRLLHVSAARRPPFAPSPTRGRRRRDGTPAPRARHGRAVHRRLVVQRRRGSHGCGLRGAARATERPRSPARRRLVLLLPAAAGERPGPVPAACRGRLHLGGFRRRHGRREGPARLRQVVHRRGHPRVDGRCQSGRAWTCVTRCSSAVPARRRPQWPRRCA